MYMYMYMWIACGSTESKPGCSCVCSNTAVLTHEQPSVIVSRKFVSDAVREEKSISICLCAWVNINLGSSSIQNHFSSRFFFCLCPSCRLVLFSAENNSYWQLNVIRFCLFTTFHCFSLCYLLEHKFPIFFNHILDVFGLCILKLTSTYPSSQPETEVSCETLFGCELNNKYGFRYSWQQTLLVLSKVTLVGL